MGIADIYFRGVLCRYCHSVVMISSMISITLGIRGTTALISDFGIVCSGPTNSFDSTAVKGNKHWNKIKESDF